MRRFLRAIGAYIWWTHPRGSVQYDVMVTLILLFVFLAPNKINFKDKPATRDGHPNEVIAYSDGSGGFVYEVPTQAVPVADGGLDTELAQALRPVAGPVAVVRYERLQDQRGQLTGYKVWVRR
jgi:hypothetical protein